MFPVELRSVLLVVGFTFVPLLLHFLLPVLLGFDNPKSELISLACQVMDSLLRFAEISSEVENHLHSANVNLIIYIHNFFILYTPNLQPYAIAREKTAVCQPHAAHVCHLPCGTTGTNTEQ